MGTRNAVGHLGEGEERRLLRRLADGDKDARRRLIEAYLGMVSALARRYASRYGVSLEDLLQEGPWHLCKRWITTTPIGE